MGDPVSSASESQRTRADEVSSGSRRGRPLSSGDSSRGRAGRSTWWARLLHLRAMRERRLRDRILAAHVSLERPERDTLIVGRRRSGATIQHLAERFARTRPRVSRIVDADHARHTPGACLHCGGDARTIETRRCRGFTYRCHKWVIWCQRWSSEQRTIVPSRDRRGPLTQARIDMSTPDAWGRRPQRSASTRGPARPTSSEVVRRRTRVDGGL